MARGRKKKAMVAIPNGKSVSFAEPNPKTFSQEISSRSRAFDFSFFASFLPNPDPVLRKRNMSIETYRDLMVDSKVGANVGTRKAGVKKYQWKIDAKKADARFVEVLENLFSDVLDLPNIIDEMLEGALFGYKPIEILWDISGGLILPVGYPKDLEGNDIKEGGRGLIGKPPEWFNFSSANRLQFMSKDNPSGEAVPDLKFLLSRRRATYQNPYGEPVLASVFWPTTFKKGGMKFWTLFLEKYGSPFLVGKYKRGIKTSEKDDFLDALENMIQDAVGIIPDDGSVEMLDRKSSGGKSDHETFLNWMDKQISQAILGQNLTSDVEGGSLAAASVHQEIKDEIVEDDARMVESTFNMLIKWIGLLNFSTDNLPVFKLFSPEMIDPKLAERDKNLHEIGVRFTPEYFQKNHGLDEADFTLAADKAVTSASGEGGSFAESSAQFPGQNAVDALVNSFSDEELQAVAEKMLAPVLDFVEEAQDYNELRENLHRIYPRMTDEGLEDLITKAVFVSESLGRVEEGVEAS